MGRYILVGKMVKAEPDLMKWGEWFETADRHVGSSVIGDVRVSTVFLGLDHGWGDRKTPLLFETMVFGGTLDGERDRYVTWDEAETGHREMVERVKGSAPIPEAREGAE